MAITVEAVYENGVLKLDKPLPLADHARVQVTVQVKPSVARESAGMLRWRGDWEPTRPLTDGMKTFWPQRVSLRPTEWMPCWPLQAAKN